MPAMAKIRFPFTAPAPPRARRRVGRNADREAGAGPGADHLCRDVDITDSDVEWPGRPAAVAGCVDRCDRDAVRTTAPFLRRPDDRPTPPQRGLDLLPTVNEEQRVHRLGRPVPDRELVGAPVTVGRDDPRPQPRDLQLGRSRVDADPARELDRTVELVQLDMRPIGPLRYDLAGIVPAVPAERVVAAAEAGVPKQRTDDLAVLVQDREGEAVRLAEAERDLCGLSLASTGGRERRRDPGPRDRIWLQLQLLGDDECGGRPGKQEQNEDRAQVPGHARRV